MLLSGTPPSRLSKSSGTKQCSDSLLSLAGPDYQSLTPGPQGLSVDVRMIRLIKVF